MQNKYKQSNNNSTYKINSKKKKNNTFSFKASDFSNGFGNQNFSNMCELANLQLDTNEPSIHTYFIYSI